MFKKRVNYSLCMNTNWFLDRIYIYTNIIDLYITYTQTLKVYTCTQTLVVYVYVYLYTTYTQTTTSEVYSYMSIRMPTPP